MPLIPTEPQDVVVVVIVAYGGPDEVAACVVALARSSFTAFEVVIVQNAAPPAFDRLCEALAGQFPADAGTRASGLAVARPVGSRATRSQQFTLSGGQTVLIAEARDNLGYGGGVNLAIATVTGMPGWRGVWILNPDTEPEPAALAKLVEYTERGGYGLVGCRLVLSDGNRIQLRGGYWRALIGRGKSIGYGEPADASVDAERIEQRLQWVSGAACYATRAFVENVGPMTESYFLYCEDVEWSLRRGRFRLGYAHDAVVRHAHGTAIGSAASIRARSRLSVYLAQRNALLLTRARWPWLYPLVVLTMMVLSVDYLVRGNRRLFATACRGWWAGVCGETGRPAGLA